ncbi:hypothetical protein L4174_022170 [Photobacterium sp. CCB-ST2H9]|nr:hypothetical protein [Photobacterium sp. CCB-ST2H9]UTM59408.1 hypothetical protein L4174_022170 [Photobacterium sp. CCB-ST2H9]
MRLQSIDSYRCFAEKAEVAVSEHHIAPKLAEMRRAGQGRVSGNLSCFIF